MQQVLEALFKTRNLHTNEERLAFLNPNFDSHTHDPMLLSDMDSAIKRIHQAIENKETIGVYTDYDCDGIPGAVIVSDFLKKVGHNDFHIYIPDRQEDGYGLAHKGIDFLHEKGATLIMTIDLGITGHESVLYAKTLGIDTIITDHHLPHDTLPDAFAVINPKKSGDEYPFKELCGTGVAYKLITAFLNEYRDEYGIAVGWEKWLLDMVALATLADMVPLVGENRVFAYYGLQVMKKTRRFGLAKLFSLNSIKTDTLNEEDVTFTIVPRINATSRMGSAYLAYDMLTSENAIDAQRLAKEIEDLNKKRKAHVALIMKEVHKMKPESFESPVIVVGDPSWRPGVLGLVAGKLVDLYHKPVFVWGGNDEVTDGDSIELLKGSCRGPEGGNIVEMMKGASELFTHFGGHTGAGGFAVSKRNVHDLKASLIESLKNIEKKLEEQESSDQNSLATPQIKESLTVSALDRELLTTIERFAPFGLGNEKPLLRLESVTVESWRQFGKTEEHLEVIFRVNDRLMKGISFFTTHEKYLRPLSVNDTYTVLCHIEMSYFIRPELRLKIIEIF